MIKEFVVLYDIFKGIFELIGIYLYPEKFQQKLFYQFQKHRIRIIQDLLIKKLCSKSLQVIEGTPLLA